MQRAAARERLTLADLLTFCVRARCCADLLILDEVSYSSDWTWYIDNYMSKGMPESQRRASPPCDWCGLVRRGISARRGRKCPKCESVHYCSHDCQRAAWVGGHWAACGAATKNQPPCAACDCAVEDAA